MVGARSVRVLGALAIGMLGMASLVLTQIVVASPAGAAPWSSGTTIDPAQGYPESISCPTTTFCAAVDQEGDVLWYHAGASPAWSAPTSIGRGETPLRSISCPTSTFCVAAELLSGVVDTWSAGTWSAPDDIDAYNQLGSVWCVTDSECDVVDAVGNLLVTSDADTLSPAWSTVAMDPGHQLTSIACPTATFCAAVDNAGQAFTTNGGTTFTAFGASDSDALGANDLTSVSCASADQCTAVDTEGNEITYSGGAWSPPILVDSYGSYFTSVSCAAVDAVFCVAVDETGQAVVDNDGAWAHPAQVDPNEGGLWSVSCPAVGNCQAVDFYGHVVTYAASTDPWSPPQAVDPGQQLTSVSCPTTDFCAAVDSAGNASIGTGADWGPFAPVDPTGGGFTSVSCPAAGQCDAVDAHGGVFTYTSGPGWSFAGVGDDEYGSIVGGYSPQISCITSSICVIVDLSGEVATNVGSGWTETGSLSFGYPDGFNAVSCSTVEEICAASTTTHEVMTGYLNTSSNPDFIEWEPPQSFGGDPVNAVACGGNCILVDGVGSVFQYDGASWGNETGIDSTALTAVGCAPSESICAVGDGSGDAILGYDADNVPSEWGVPVTVDPGQSIGTITCASDGSGLPLSSTELCVAGDGAGNLVTYDDVATWSSPESIDPAHGALAGISCPTAAFCAAVDAAGNIVTYHAAASPQWSAPSPHAPNRTLTAISCPTDSLCVATDDAGNTETSTDADSPTPSWVSQSIESPSVLTAISCPTASFCAAADRAGHVLTTSDPASGLPSWSRVAVDPSGGGINSISCPTTSLCAAADADGNVLISSDPGSGSPDWSTTSVDTSGGGLNGITSISCATTSYCAAVDSYGNVFTSQDPASPTPSWSTRAIDSGAQINEVSCTAADDCVAVDQTGSVLTETNGHWSAPDTLDAGEGVLDAVSCPYTAFCVAVGLTSAYAFTGAVPTVQVTPSPLPVTPGTVDYTVTVSGSGPGPAGGTVTLDDPTPGVCSPLESGSATCTETESAGSSPYAVTASYLGDENYGFGSSTVTVTGDVASSCDPTTGCTAMTATPDDITVTASGGTTSDALTESQYSADPGLPLTDGSGNYFDVAVSPIPSGFHQVVVQDCNGVVAGSTTLSWYDPTAPPPYWTPVTGSTLAAPSPSYPVVGGTTCVAYTLDSSTSSPQIGQLSGTVFGAVGPVGNGPAVTTSSLPGASRLVPYSETLAAAGGTTPYKWTLASGALPIGLKLSSAGVIAGTPTANGSDTFTVKVTDTKTRAVPAASATAILTITVDQPAPTITTAVPSAGPGAGGTDVVLTGTALESASSVDFGSTPATSVKLSKSGTTLTAVAPPGAGTQLITVTTPGGSATTSFDYLPPTITSVSPSSAPGAGGTKVTITGTELNGASSVLFGSTPASSYKVSKSGTSITAVSPPGGGAQDITVTTPGGSATSSFNDLGPTITGFTPSGGGAGGGTKVTISGTDLVGATAVTFGSTPATGYAVSKSGSSITAYAPSGSGSAPITVTTPGGSATSTSDFTW